MGVNAEGKISLSVELQNFKNIASDLKKGLSAQLKQVPLDVEFNNKDLEKKAAEAIRNINEILSKSRVKNLDLSSILPNFVNEINKEGISDEIRMQMIKGFESALTNLRDIGIKQDYSKLKGFSGEDLKAYIADLNDVMDILKTIEGLTERQKQGILTTVLPSLSDLSGRGKDAAKKEYTKGAKKLDAILQLSGDYNGVLQYGVNPTATLTALNELNKKAKSGKELNKNEKQDLLGYLLRGKYLGLEFGKAEDENLKDLDYEGLLKIAKEKLDKATVDYIETKSTAYFAALDKIYNSSAQEIAYSDLTKGIKNTTNQKMQSMYDAEAPENPPTRIRAGNVTKRVIKLSSKEKPELRKRTQNEYKKDTGRTKLHSEEELKDFEFDDEEKSIEEIEKKIQEIENKLSQVRDKITKSKDDQAQLEEQITNQEKIFEEKDTAYTTYKSKYEKYSSFAKNAKYESEALKGTIANLDGQLEEEKQNKEKIESRYNQLIKKREEIKKEIEEKEKQLEAVLPKIQEQETGFEKQLTDLNNKKKEAQKVVKDREAHNKEVMPIQDEWLEWYDEALQKEYKFEGAKAKSEAFDTLKRLGNEYLQFRRNPELSTALDKEAESARFAVKHYKLWQAAKEAGVAESRLDREKFDTDDDFAYRQAVEYLQKQRENTEQRRENLKAELEKAKAEVSKIQEDIDEVKKQQEDLQKEKSKLLRQFRARPANNEDENEAKIRREQSQLESSNSKIQKLETSKVEAENRLNKLEGYLQKNELTDERKTKYDNQLEELKKERDAQEKILEQKKNSLQTTISEQNQLVQLEQELQESQNALIQKREETKARQEELDRQEKERRKKAEEERKKQEEANRKQQGNKTETDSEIKTTTEEVQNSGAGSTATSATINTATSIPPEKLQEILTLLGNIQKALGTLDDSSDIPSITQSIKSMADALKELSVALGEIKQKDFNLNIGLPNNNPIGQQGEAKRKILKELEQQYNELNSYFVNRYGDDSSAFNALSKLEGGSNYVATMMSDYSVIGDTNASLSDKIEVYKTLIEQLRSFVLQEGGDLNKVLTNVLSPEEIINKITDDVAKLNPTTAISKIFEDVKVSIDASMAQINTESKGFNFLSGSAEEAAAAKQKFVEANKDVLQSIVASMPKIEQEAKALEKVEDIKDKSKSNADIKNNNKENEDTIKQQNKLLEQQQPSLQQIEEAQLKEQQKIQQKVQEQLREEVYDDYSKPQRPKYDFEPDYEDLARQAQEARQYYQEQISNDFEIKAEAKLDLVQDETGQLSLFDDVLPEKNWGQEIIQVTDDISKSAIKGQISLQDLEEAEQRVTTQYAKLRSNKDFLQGEDVSEKFLESYEGISTEKTQELFKTLQELKQVKASLQDSFDKNGNLIGDPLQVEDTYNTYIKLIDIVKRLKTEITGQYSEETVALKLKQDAEKAKEELEQLRTNIEQTFAKISGSKEFVQGKSLNADYISKFGVFDNTKNLEKLSRYFAYLEKTKSELSSSFDRQGQLIGDPTEVENLINQYNTLIEEIKKIKLEIESPHSEENIILQMLKDSKKLKESLENLYPKLPSLEKITPSVDKVLQPFREMNLPVTESRGQLLDSVKRMQEINSELSSSFDAQGKLIGSPKRVQELILEYKNLIKQVDELKAKISSPMSEENIALKLAKDAEKAEKQLDELKGKVDKTLGKSNLFEAQTQKTINTYGAFEGNGEGQRSENLITSEVIGEKYGDNFAKQQEQVKELTDKLREYKDAVKELDSLRYSDNTSLEQLTQANDKVKNLETSITTLSQTIKTSGIANATNEQIGKLKNQLETFLNNTPNLTKDVRAQLQDYIKVLDSGASVSKTRYASMTADLNKFRAAQASGSTIWEQMVGKMREGVAFLATKFSFYQIFNQFRQGFEVIHQFDDALTEMMKVSDETRASLERYQKTTFETADSIGTSALQIQNSTADFMRLGETLNQAAESAKSANVLMNVSEFQSIDEATKSLIAMGAAYNDLSKMNIIDKLNEVGLKIA